MTESIYFAHDENTGNDIDLRQLPQVELQAWRNAAVQHGDEHLICVIDALTNDDTKLVILDAIDAEEARRQRMPWWRNAERQLNDRIQSTTDYIGIEHVFMLCEGRVQRFRVIGNEARPLHYAIASKEEVSQSIVNRAWFGATLDRVAYQITEDAAFYGALFIVVYEGTESPIYINELRGETIGLYPLERAWA